LDYFQPTQKYHKIKTFFKNMELEMLDYRFRTVIKNGEKKDYAIKVDARKFAIKNSIFKRNGLFFPRVSINSLKLCSIGYQ